MAKQAKEDKPVQDPNLEQHSEGVHPTHPNAFRQDAKDKLMEARKALDAVEESISKL